MNLHADMVGKVKNIQEIKTTKNDEEKSRLKFDISNGRYTRHYRLESDDLLHCGFNNNMLNSTSTGPPSLSLCLIHLEKMLRKSFSNGILTTSLSSFVVQKLVDMRVI